MTEITGFLANKLAVIRKQKDALSIIAFTILIFLILLGLQETVIADSFDGQNVTIIEIFNLTNQIPNIQLGGICTNGTTSSPTAFWIADYFSDKVFYVNGSFYNLSNYSISSQGLGSVREIATNGSDFWLFDTSDTLIYHMNSTFKNYSDQFNIPATTNSFTRNASNFFITWSGQSKINVTNLSGSQQYLITCDALTDCTSIKSITTINGSTFYAILGVISPELHVMLNNGTTIATRSLLNVGTASVGDGNLASITTTNGIDFWIADEAEKTIYHISAFNETWEPVKFVPPTPNNASSQTGDSIFVNLSTTLAGNQYSFLDFDKSLIFWLRFDEYNSTGSPQDLVKRRNGTVVGSVTFNATNAKFGNASHYPASGLNKIVFPHDDDLNLSGNKFTISAWIRTNYTTTAYIVKKGRNGQAGVSYEMSLSTGTGAFCRINQQVSSNTYRVNLNVTHPVNYQWFHMVCVWNGTAIKIYFNGQLNNQTIGSTTLITNIENLTIGGENSVTSPLLNGSIDDVMMFNRSLDDSEILSLYNSTQFPYQENFTSLAQVSHTFIGYSVNESGLMNNTDFRTVTITSGSQPDTTAPFVFLQAPANATLTNLSSISFNATFTDNINLSNGTFYLWNSTNSLINTTTINISGTSSGINVTVYFSYNDTFKWNYRACDNSSNCAFNSSNFTYTFNSSYGIIPQVYYPLIVQFVSPTLGNNSQTTNTSYELKANITSQDLLNITYNWNGTNITIFDDTLRVWLNFDNISALGETYAQNTIVHDLSSYHNDANITNTSAPLRTFPPIWLQNGKFNGAFNFTAVFPRDSANNDNGSSILIPHSNSLNPYESDFSMMFWFNCPPGSIDNDISRKGSTGTSPGNIMYKMEIGGYGTVELISLDFISRAGVGGATSLTLEWQTSVCNNAWHYAVGQRRGNVAELFVDGVKRLNGTFTGDISNTANLSIGSKDTQDDDHYNGLLDEYRLYINRSFSESEIQQMYFMNLNLYQEGNFTLYVNQSKSISNTSTTAIINPLNYSNYTYYVFVKNQNLVTNITDLRTVNIVQSAPSDTTAPSISIVYPGNNSNFSIATVNVNYTVSDLNLQACWWTNNSGQTNQTITCGNNITTMNWLDGIHNISIWANDTSGNINSSSITFTSDTTKPYISLTSPANDTTSYSTLFTFMATATDNVYLKNATLFIWNSTGTIINQTNTSASGVSQALSTQIEISTEGNYSWNYLIYDNVGNFQWNNTNYTFRYQATAPGTTGITIMEVFNMTNKISNVQFGGIYTNGTGTNPDSFWIADSYNDRAFWLNSSFDNRENYSILSDNIGSPNEMTGNNSDFWIYDSSDSLVYHLNKSFYNYTDHIPVKGSVSGIARNASNFFFTSTDNSINVTNLSGSQQYLITCDALTACGNAKSLTTVNGSMFYVMVAFTNDLHILNRTGGTIAVRSLSGVGSGTVGNGNLASFTTSNGNDFWIEDYSLKTIYHIAFYDILVPAVNITYPIHNANYSSIVTALNYTVSDINLYACWYSLNGGTTNTSVSCGVNKTGLTSIEGRNNWTVYANDTSGNLGISSINFTIDTIAPIVTITYPQNTSYLDSYNFSSGLNITIVESGTGESTRWYSINNGGTNITFTGNTSIAGLTAGSNKVIVWINDSVGNINSTNVTFSLLFTPKINLINISNLSTSYTRDGISSGLVGFWKLDQNNSLQVDSSQYSNNATSNGLPQATPNGKIGGAYVFNSSSYLEVSNLSMFNMTNNFTVIFWAYPLARDMSKVSYMIVKGCACGAPGRMWDIGLSTNNALFFQYTQDGSTALTKNFNAINQDAWNFIAVSYSDGNITFFNGSYYNSTTISINQTSTNNKLVRIGAGQCTATDANSRWFNGTLDEVRIYNRSLTYDEMQSLYSITNPTFQEYPNVTLNVTVTDEDTPQASLYYRWLVDGVEKLVGLAKNVFNYIFNGRTNTVTVVINDTNNYQVTQNWNISEYSVPPTISIVYPGNNSNFSNPSVTINYTFFDLNLQACWWTNNSGQTNNSIACGLNISQNWSEGLNTVIVYANDSFGNKNSSSVRFRIDTTGVVVTILAPSSGQEFDTNVSLSLNYSVADAGVGVSSCWFNLDKTANISLPNCLNTTFNTTDGSHTIYIYSNDTFNNLGSDSHSFTISLSAPSITLYNPSNNSYLNYKNNIVLNWTATDSNGLSTAQIWHNFNGSFSLNLSRTNTISGVMANQTYNISTDGVYLWNVWVNDSLNNGRFSTNNNTFIVDTTLATVYITGISSTVGSQNVYFNQTASDANLLSCKYAVLNSSGDLDAIVHPFGTNNSVGCNANNTLFTVSDYGTYTLWFWALDRAGNENSTFTTFTVSSGGVIIIVTGGGGGGGSELTVNRVPATNFSIVSTSLGNKIDLVLARDSVKPRKINFYLINRDIDEVDLELICDATSAVSSNNLSLNLDICDYIEFEKTTITVSPNEVVNTQSYFTILTPYNSSFGDEFSFNILALQNSGTSEEKFAKLSVTARTPIWAEVYKWSYVPLQDISLPNEKKKSYPVFMFSLAGGFIVFVSFFLATRKKMPATAFFLGLFLALMTAMTLQFAL